VEKISEFMANGMTPAQWTTNEAEQDLAITAPPDLQERLQQLPREGAQP
jgi:hypothetical protein